MPREKKAFLVEEEERGLIGGSVFLEWWVVGAVRPEAMCEKINRK